ncbi:MAG TPA: SAM-dependent methyltransferase, partial [Actinomycetes bacterium]|nr:SAM-dependent methyltransferase [Actinomycetes bacterium]
LVVHFMTDPVTGLAEMGRVTGPGGRVAANVWDHGGSSGPLATFWRAAGDVDPAAPDESGLPGTREGHLVELAAAAGLRNAEPSALTVRIPFTSFEEWWEPFTFGVGPAGSYVASLDETRRELLTERCRDLLPSAPFEITATAWCVVATP